jgi:hypothetical protein
LQNFSLNSDLIQNIFRFAKPLGHQERPANLNLGFGFIYYGIVRALRPNHIVVIGSGFGFSVVCFALGLKDNAKGRLSFVDPSYDVFKHGPFKTVGGRGNWDDPNRVEQHFEQFGVSDWVTHYKLEAEEFFPRFKALGLPKIDLAFVDGNHSYGHVRYDFVEVLKHAKKNTYVFLHDTNIYIREIVRNSGVRRWLKLIKRQKDYFEIIDFPFASGVAIVHVLEDEAWNHLQL